MAKETMPAALADEISMSPPAVNTEKLEQLKDLVRTARDGEGRKAELEELLEECKNTLNELYYKKLPDLMGELNLPALTLGAEGNYPAVDAKAQPYYAANIAAGWPQDKRLAAFKYLDENGHGDLIKTEVTVVFPRDERGRALSFMQMAKSYGTPVIKENVHNQTLTAWLREQVEDHHYVPDLETIGGTVGRVVKLKPRKPD